MSKRLSMVMLKVKSFQEQHARAIYGTKGYIAIVQVSHTLGTIAFSVNAWR
jgi:hypothetical protein